jgi:putative flippase GtrA
VPETTRPQAEEPAAPPPSGDDFRGRLDAAVDRVLPSRFHPYREQILYLLIGGWNTVFGYLVFAGLYWALNGSLPVTVILIISWVIAVTNAYVCYRYLVFRSRGRMHHEIPRFLLVYAVILAANLLVLPLALRVVSLNAYVVQGIYTLAVVIVSYVGHRVFSFREGRALARADGSAGSSGEAPNASQTSTSQPERES